MKKIYSIFITAMLLFVLAACGNSENVTSGETETKTVTESKENTSDVAEDAKSTEKQADKAEDVEQNTSAAEETSDEYSFEGPDGSYNIIGAYYNDQIINEDELVTLDFDGFKLTPLTFLVDFVPNEQTKYKIQHDERFAGKDTIKLLATTAKAKNTNDFEVNYAGGITVETDSNEQISSFDGSLFSSIDAEPYAPQEEREKNFLFVLENQESLPDHIEMTFERPSQVDEYFNMSYLGERQTIEYNFGTMEELEAMN